MARLLALFIVALALPAAARVPSHFNGGVDPWVELEAEARRAAQPPPVERRAEARVEHRAEQPVEHHGRAQVADSVLPEPEPVFEPVPKYTPPREPQRVDLPNPAPDFADLATPPALEEPETPAAAPEVVVGDPLDALMDLVAPDPRLLSEAIVEASNEARRHHGLPALEADLRLHRAAAGHAHRMARLGFFSHRDPHAADRRTPTDRARSAGIANPNIAENIATAISLDLAPKQSVYVLDAAQMRFSLTPDGPPLARRSYRMFARHVVRQWLASPGHRRNLLAKEAVQIGAAAAPFLQAGGIPTLSAVQVFQWHQPVVAPQ